MNASRSLRHLLSDFTYRCLTGENGVGQGLRILMYHRVTDAHPGDRLCVLPNAFAAQMRWLHDHGYRTIRLDEAVRSLTAGEPYSSRCVVITFDDGFEDNLVHAVPELARHGFTGCFFVPTAFIERGPTAMTPAADQPMSWGQLAQLLAGGHEIGAHSVTHRRLTLLPRDEMRREVRDSKAALERRLQHPVAWFCYPAGGHDAAVRAAVAEAGYQAACTVAPGANRRGADAFALRRTEISAFDSLWDFEKKLAGAYDALHATVQWWQRVARPSRECRNAVEVADGR